jgi:Lrp/AsnC family leucine-responsive transcriptional regulator
VLDREKLGIEILAFVSVSVEVHQLSAVNNIKKKIFELPEVLECYQISGDEDIIIKVAVKDIRSYNDWVMNRLSRIHAIHKIKTSFVISTVKKSNDYQLDSLVGRTVIN